MNKKVLTLCAGFLLAGALTGGNVYAAYTNTAAEEALTAISQEKYPIDYGKYFTLGRTAIYQGSTWSPVSDSYFLDKDATDGLVYTNIVDPENKSSFWKFEDVTEPGDKTIDAQYVAKVKVVNAENWTLAFDANDADANGHLQMADGDESATTLIDEFYVEVENTGRSGLLVCWIGTQKYVLGNINTPLATGKHQAVLVKDGTFTSANLNDVNLVGINEVAIRADQLNAELNGGFELNFSSNGKAYANLVGAEAFAGKLTAKAVAGTSGTVYNLVTEDGNYVVLSDDYIGEANSTLDGTDEAFYRGYNFKTVLPHVFTEASFNRTRGEFTIFKSYDFNQTDSLIVTLPNIADFGEIPAGGLNTTIGTPAVDNPEKGLRVFVSSVNVAGVRSDLLTTIDYMKANDKLAAYDLDDYYDSNSEGGALAPYIAFGASNIVTFADFAGKIWNITDVNGNALSPKFVTADIDSYPDLFAEAGQVDLTKPEGHWLVNADGQGFINRESGSSEFDRAFGWTIRKTSTPDLYEIYNTRFSRNEWFKVYIKEAKNAELGWTEKGYVKFNMDDEANNGKYLSFETSLGVTAYIGKDADDNVIVTPDASKAIEFRVKEMTHDFKNHAGLAGVDTLLHITNYLGLKADGSLDNTAKDTLQFYQYALYENFSEKYLRYNEDTKKFELSTWSRTDNAHEDFDIWKNFAFVLKEKADGSYILVRDYDVNYDHCSVIGGVHHTAVDPDATDPNDNLYKFDNYFHASLADAHKAYAATQPGTLADMASLYNYNDNDRITMENTNQTEYMYVTGSQDTVKIALQGRPNFFLYEQGRFLGLEHTADVEDMAAAMLVDTAYVRNNTYRPQYLLAVDAWHKDEVWDSHPESEDKIPPHLIHPDTTFGRFLVNVVDSAVTYKGSDKTNPYIFDRNDYYRLAFIDGVHTGDKLFLNTGNGKQAIDLGNNDDKVCTFAFRYVDENRDAVIIETRYNTTADNTIRRGYLKYQNNVAVVTDDYEDAHIFTVDNETTEAPTANESISAEDAVSVTATDGAVTIKGAEGKNVVIATILGKVVANEVINSDNETIAVPAGIAVVSVDGESFKVVVK